MLSSKNGLFDKAKGRVVGADDYLTKPFTKASLLETIQRFNTQQKLATN
jgi:twitching motility two-component system response regulator PilG